MQKYICTVCDHIYDPVICDLYCDVTKEDFESYDE